MSDIPQKIGKYEIKRLLGEGAMGVVYEGLDSAIERRVAIKVLHPHLLTKRDGKEFLERFQREAKSAARCTHQNIVMVLEYGEDDGLPFIAMEFVDGLPLQDVIQSGKKISLKNTLAIIYELLKAIHAAHKLGVVHRDIKTANIIVCRKDSSIKLADFGIARLNDNPSMTLTGAIVGTPRYMAPEQMFGLKVDERADLFSIAMVFAELLTCLPQDNPFPMARLPVLDGLPKNNQINFACEYPAALVPVLQKALAIKAGDRYQSAAEFAKALKQSLNSLKKPTLHDEATQVVQPGSNGGSSLRDDLDTLTNILSEFIGPVARNVIREQETQHTSMPDLVRAVASEIPQQSQRNEFFKSWERQTGSGLMSGQSSRGGTSSSGSSLGGRSSRGGSSVRLEQSAIQKISDDFISYIGPFAPRLVDYYSQEAEDKDEFIRCLAEEIPDQGDRDEFVKKWSMV